MEKTSKVSLDTTLTYKKTVQEVLDQFKNKESSLGKKITLLIVPPTVVFVFASTLGIYILSTADRSGNGDILSTTSLQIIWAMLGLFAVAILYYIVMSSLFFIEKLIWVDSQYDKKTLSEGAGWHIAKKLFWPSQLVRIQLFFLYYIPGMIVAAALVYICVLVSRFIENVGVSGQFLGIANIIIATLLVIYFYALKIKLKFLWFIFLDFYAQPDYSFFTLIKEVKLLNTIDREKVRSRAVVIELLSDIVGTTGGRGVGQTARRVVANEPLRQASLFARTVAYYSLYRHVRTLAHNNPQFVNEALYQLS